MTEQDPSVGTPDLPPNDGSKSAARARGGHSQTAEVADVIVVGAGPAGSAVAYYLASAGLDVLVLEKSRFPREKVCGDGLTPRAAKALASMGVRTDEADGWLRNKGLRIIGGGGRIELDWPDMSSYPGYGLVRTRLDFDQTLARHAAKAGARLMEGINVTGPVLDDRTGRIIGVTAQETAGGKDAPERTFSARLVVAADGNSSRLSVAMGLHKRDDRPLGVAVRTYYTSPRHDDDYLEAWLDLWDGSALLPGYGWIFGMGDGTSNVGLGILSTSTAYGKTDYRALLRSWLDSTPLEWGFREGNAAGKIAGAALPMGFNRTPHYRDGLLLVGDAGGMVNSFNGEGIAYAMQSARFAAECTVQALARPEGLAREHALRRYPAALREELGGYFRLGNGFSRLIAHPAVMRAATRHGLPRPTLMRFLLKLLANLYDSREGDAMDRVITAMTRLTPSV